MSLTDSHWKILESLVNIKKHNSNRNNMRAVLQISRYKKEDIDYLVDQKMVKYTLLKEYQITDLGEKELKNRL